MNIVFRRTSKGILRPILALALMIALGAIVLLVVRHVGKAAAAPWAPTASEWSRRKRLTLVNNSGQAFEANTTYSVTINTKALYDAGHLQSGCEDLRVYYQPNDTTAKKLNYYFDPVSGTTCATSEATTIHFPLQADIANSGEDADYYMYYKNSGASSEATIDAFDVGDKNALLHCGFKGDTTCINADGAESPTTESGAIRYSGSKSALSFDGVDDKVESGTISRSGNTGTVELWVNPSKTRTQAFFAQNPNVGGFLTLQTGGSYPDQLSVRLGSSGIAGTGVEISPNTWTHLALTFNNGSYILYKNGTNSYSGAYSGSVNSAPLQVGYYYDGGSYQNYFSGFIDEVRASSIVRYTSNFTPQTTPFVRDEHTKLLLHFDENGDDPRNSGKAIDDSGNANHGTITGAKYVAGVMGVDNSTSDTGNVSGANAYAGREGIYIEEATTNKITNPSFEHGTYDTNWTAGANIAATENTTAPYYKFGSKSVKLVASADDTFTTNMTAASTNAHFFSVYVYDGTSGSVGGTVDSSVAQLYYDSEAITTTYTDVGGGWWRLTYLGTTGNDWWNGYSAGIGKLEEYASSNRDSDQALYATSSDQYLSQGFQLNQTTTIDKVNLYLKEVGSTSNRTRLEIQTDSGGVPSGSVVTNGTSQCAMTANHGTSYSYLTFGFSSAVSLSADTQYHLVLKSYTDSGCTTEQAAPNGTTYMSWGYDNSSSSYSNGDRATYDGGSWNTQASADHIFQIFSPAALLDYGLQVKSGKTVYVDGMQIGSGFGDAGELHITGYVDGSLGDGYSWNGEAHNSTSTRAAGSLRYSTTSNIYSSAGTVSMWLKAPYLTNAGSWGYAGMFFDSYLANANANDGVVFHRQGTGNLYCYHGTQNINLGAMTTDAWIHVVATWDGNTFSCYKNGSQSSSADSGEEVKISSNFSIGSGDEYGSVQYGDATFSDFRIFDTALTTTEVADLYYSGLGAHKEGAATEKFSDGEPPTSAWHLDEGYGTTLYDSINGNNATLGTGASAPSWQSEDMCVSGKCLQFDGTDDYATVANTITGIKSVSFWVRPNTTTEYFVDLNGSAYISASSGTISATGFTDPTIYVNGQPSTTLAANTWQHISVTTGTALGGGAIKFGQISTSHLQGFLDEIKIYPYVRSAAQVKTEYNAGKAGASSVKGTAASLGGTGLPASSALADGLVGYWKMDETSWDGSAGEILDASGNGNNGIRVGAATTDTGNFGNSGSFTPGTDDGANLGSGSSLNETNGLSFSAWIYPDAYTETWPTIYNKGPQGPSTGYVWIYQTNDGQLHYQYATGSQYKTINSSCGLTTGTWQHITMTHDRSNKTVRCYLNGELKDTDTYTDTALTVTSGTAYLGAYQGQGGNPCNYDGRIDEARAYNRVLSPAEVRQLYAWAPGPVAYYNFDEGTGGYAYDISGNGNTGTWSGTGSHWASGKYGKGGRFKSNYNDYVQVSYSPLLALNQYTVSAWAKVDDFTSANGILGTRIGSDNTFDFKIQSTRLHGDIGDGSTWLTTSADCNYNWSVDTWYYISYAVYENEAKIYINGQLCSTKSYSGIPLFMKSNQSLRIGYCTSGEKSNSTIDDVRIYNYARTQKQIVEDMLGSPKAVSAGGGNAGQPALAYYRFDEGADNTCSGGSNDVCNSGNGGTTLDGTSTATRTNDGKFGKALDFDGTDDVVTITNSTAIDLNTGLASGFSVSAWIYADSDGETDTGQIFWKGNSTYLRTSGQSGSNLNLDASLDLATPATKSLTAPITTGTWNHLVMAWTDDDDDEITLWVNGKNMGSSTNGVGPTTAESNSLLIGGSTNFDGKIDEFKVYNYELSEDEVKLDYNRGAAAVLGTLSVGTGNTAPQTATSQEYCIPGDSTSCAAPLARWDLNEGNGITAGDSSGNGHSGTITGANWTTGKIGKALSFDGSGDYVTVTSRPDIGEGCTYQLWFKANQLSRNESLLSNWNGDDKGIIIHKISTNNALRVFVDNGSSNVTLNNFFDSLAGTWTYLSVVVSNNVISVYKNGSLYDNSGTYSNASTTESRNLYIGEWWSVPTFSFSGLIDQVRIYNYARSPAQIAWDYNRGKPVGWWKFDECEGETLYDSSGNGNNGTWSGAGDGTQTSVGTCTTSGAWYNGASGKLNSSLNFDGTDDYVAISDVSEHKPTTQMSVSTWVKTTDVTQSYAMFLTKSTTGGNGWNLRFDSTTGKPMFTIYVGGSYVDQDDYTTSIACQNNAWCHVVGLYDGSTVKTYVNGKLSGSFSTSGDITPQATTTFIGKRSDGYSFSGQVDDARIYNYALTATQVKELYNGGAVRFGE